MVRRCKQSQLLLTNGCDNLAVIGAWNVEYRGDANRILLKAVDEVHQKPPLKHYAKLVPVAQSSGTGKSKCVDKIATERILFPLCLREHLGHNYFGMYSKS